MKIQMKFIIVLSILTILGLVFNLFIKDYILDKKGVESIATITKFGSKNLNPNGGSGSNLMQYEYYVKGSKYIGSKSIEIKDLKFPLNNNKLVGTKIQIIYLPIFPEINKIVYGE